LPGLVDTLFEVCTCDQQEPKLKTRQLKKSNLIKIH